MALPELISFDGDWIVYVEKLYAVYLDTVVNGNLEFEGLKISLPIPTFFAGQALWILACDFRR